MTTVTNTTSVTVNYGAQAPAYTPPAPATNATYTQTWSQNGNTAYYQQTYMQDQVQFTQTVQIKNPWAFGMMNRALAMPFLARSVGFMLNMPFFGRPLARAFDMWGFRPLVERFIPAFVFPKLNPRGFFF